MPSLLAYRPESHLKIIRAAELHNTFFHMPLPHPLYNTRTRHLHALHMPCIDVDQFAFWLCLWTSGTERVHGQVISKHQPQQQHQSTSSKHSKQRG